MRSKLYFQVLGMCFFFGQVLKADAELGTVERVLGTTIGKIVWGYIS